MADWRKKMREWSVKEMKELRIVDRRPIQGGKNLV